MEFVSIKKVHTQKYSLIVLKRSWKFVCNRRWQSSFHFKFCQWEISSSLTIISAKPSTTNTAVYPLRNVSDVPIPWQVAPPHIWAWQTICDQVIVILRTWGMGSAPHAVWWGESLIVDMRLVSNIALVSYVSERRRLNPCRRSLEKMQVTNFLA